MRIHPWLAALSSVLLLIAAGESSARAQQDSTESAVYESDRFEDALVGRARLTSASTDTPAAPGVRGQSPGGGFQPAYQNNTHPAGMWPPAAPPQSYHPYPRVSPYYSPNVARTTTHNRNGLWFRDMLQRERRYFTTLEYLMVRYRRPGSGIVGASPAPTFNASPDATDGGAGGLVGVPINNQGLGGQAQFGFDGSVGPQRITVGPGVFPFPYVSNDADGLNRAFEPNSNLFPIRSLSAFANHFKADGMRARWGFFNEDDSGFMVTGWFGTEGSDRFQFGAAQYNGVPVTQDFILANTDDQAFVFPRNGALPLLVRDDFMNSGQDPIPELVDLGFTGMAQKFDVLFQVESTSFAAGGALNWYHEPIYKRKWVTVRPTIGARYQYLDETFAFRGIDSGFGYDVTALDDGDDDPTFRPDTIVQILDDAGNPFFFEANLRSEIDSHMAGPEAGIRYDFGSSDHFSIWGQSSFALLANHQRMALSGSNIGDPLNYWLVTNDNWADPADGIDTSFRTKENHTSASPMFEQSVFVEMDVFRYIPVLKNMHVLENAQFRTGYTYTVIGNVARPPDVIEWNSFPELPVIRSGERSTWHTHNWSFAIDWKF